MNQLPRPRLLALLAAFASSAAAADKPNIILCMTDDQGWGDVSYNGLTAIKTPNLDAMAAAGLRFNRFYSAAPVCSPTRASVLTGRHPNRMGTFLYGYPIRKQELTIAQVLKTAGYTTGHFGKWHLNGVSGPGKPIAGDDPLSPGRCGFDEWLSVTNFFDLNPAMSRNGTTVQLTGDGSDIIVEEAVKFIAQAGESKKPFLAVVWFGNPHNPHKALEADLKAAGGSHYYGEIVGIDRAMGRLRSELRRLGVADNTLVWFNSDNGATGPGSTGGLRGKKGSVWEGGVRVPGIIEWPARIKKPAVTEIPAVTSDIFPTVLELVGIKPEKPISPIDGVSLVSLIDGRMTERPRPIGFWHYSPNAKAKAKAKDAAGDAKPEAKPDEKAEMKAVGKGAAGFTRDAGQSAWTDNRFKLIKLAAGKFELYDIVADPKESKDLAAEKPDVVARMRGELEAWQDSVLRSFRGEDYPARKAD